MADLEKKHNCQPCLILTRSLKQYSTDRLRMNNEIAQQQNTLYQLKDNVRDMKIENISTNNGLKQRAKLWKCPSFCVTSIEDTDLFPLESQSISSRLPLVRPRKIRCKTIMENNDNLTNEVDVESSIVEFGNLDEYDIPQVEPGCEVCKSLQDQIRKEIVELRMLKRKSVEKVTEITEYQRQEDELNSNKVKLHRQISQLSTTSNTFKRGFVTKTSQSSDSSDLLSPRSPSSIMYEAGFFEFTEDLPNEGGLEDNSVLSRFSALFDEYQSNKVDMKALQGRQDYIVEIMHSIVVETKLSDSVSLPSYYNY